MHEDDVAAMEVYWSIAQQLTFHTEAVTQINEKAERVLPKDN